MNTIKEGEYVIVKTDSVLRLVEIRKNKPQFLGKRKAHLHAAVGHPFGSFFEIKSDASLVPTEKPDDIEQLLVKYADDVKDNRSLTDSNESQKLTTSDIEALKQQGKSGQEMVKIIIENSNTFQEKTAFAQEKYLRKKQKKYQNVVQLLKPNIRLLAEMYYMQGPLKICNLRIDSLAQMLTFCNVMSAGRYMVLDSVLGLLTAAVLERLGTEGCVVQIHTGSFSIHPTQLIIKSLNVPVQDLCFNIDLKSAVSVLKKVKNHNTEDEKMIVVSTDETQTASFRVSKTEKIEHIQKTTDILNERNMDGLLVAIKNHPSCVLQLLDLMSPSRPFAIFSMYQSPLVDCYVKLKSRGDIISLNISETWLRKYQVLPDRTHPCYNMSGTGGFLLTGIKVELKQR